MLLKEKLRLIIYEGVGGWGRGFLCPWLINQQEVRVINKLTHKLILVLMEFKY
jgi:hypothetical protein